MTSLGHLISDDYLAQLRAMHASPRGIGHSGRKHAAEILAVAAAMGARTVLDYGCGGGTLRVALAEQAPALDVREYDPAIVGKAALPEAADIVVCTDVLEHVERDKLPAVLGHICGLARLGAFLVIATTPAHKLLPDGRNAHLIVEPAEWWRDFIFSRAGWLLRSQFIRSDSEGVLTDVALWLLRERS